MREGLAACWMNSALRPAGHLPQNKVKIPDEFMVPKKRKEWSIKYLFHLLPPAGGKRTVPWPFQMAHQGATRGGVGGCPPSSPTRWFGHRRFAKGIFSLKVGCNVHAVPKSKAHVTQVSLTPRSPAIAIQINKMPQNNNPGSRSHCLLWSKNFKQCSYLELPLHYTPWFHRTRNTPVDVSPWTLSPCGRHGDSSHRSAQQQR